ncbi:MAG: hypothetical protein JWP52_1734 [Rhizobacter sp.]|nr:hypothetical protein [Rhizobacter sp.]
MRGWGGAGGSDVGALARASGGDISAAGHSPLWKFVAHLWEVDCNMDYDGNSRAPDDKERTELTLSLRGEPVQHVAVDPIAEDSSTLAARSAGPALAEKVAAFLGDSLL